MGSAANNMNLRPIVNLLQAPSFEQYFSEYNICQEWKVSFPMADSHKNWVLSHGPLVIRLWENFNKSNDVPSYSSVIFDIFTKLQPSSFIQSNLHKSPIARVEGTRCNCLPPLSLPPISVFVLASSCLPSWLGHAGVFITMVGVRWCVYQHGWDHHQQRISGFER